MGRHERGLAGLCSRRLGFTLVELLVVIAIVAIVSVAGSIAFKSMGGANQRQRAAVNQAVALIDQARSLALASGEDIYLAVATGDAEFGTQRFRATATFRRHPETNAYVPVSEWKILPQGIAFLNGSSAATPGNLLGPSVPQADFTYAGKTVRAPYLLFSAQGAMVSPSAAQLSPTGAEATLYLFQGAYSASGTTPIPTAKTSKGNAVKDAITISRYTGRVKHLTYDTDA